MPTIWLALVEALDLGSAIHVGHSTGGGEVARYIGRHGTTRVAKAVLIGAVPPLMLKTAANPGGLPIEVVRRDPRRRAGRSIAVLQGSERPFYGCNRPGAKVSQGMRDSFWLQGMLAGHKSALDCIKAFSETDFTEDLKKIDVPTLIMHGDDDQIVPIGASAMLSSKLVKDADAQGLSRAVARDVHDQQGSDQRGSARVHQGVAEREIFRSDSRIDWLTVQVRPYQTCVRLQLVDGLATPIFGSLSAKMEGDDAVRSAPSVS